MNIDNNIDNIDNNNNNVLNVNNTQNLANGNLITSQLKSLSLQSDIQEFSESSIINRDKINDRESYPTSPLSSPYIKRNKTIEESISSESLIDNNNNNNNNIINNDKNDGGIDEEKLETEVKKISVTIGPQHFDLIKIIGEGAFGKVLLVRNILDDRLYAMKVLSKKILKKTNNIAYMKSERDILTKIDHPFVVALWYAFQTESKLFLVMDFLNGGELFFHLKRRGLILENEARFYLGEMILAIEFLHSNGVIHRDLKPENVLLNGDGHVVLTDFGLAKEIGSSEKVRTLCGTSEYMAPEMLARNGYGKSVDWWSLGALFYEMLAGKPPFSAKNQSNKELEKKIMTEKFTAPSYLTANAHSLLKGMLEKDSNKRLGSAKSTMFSIGGVPALKSHSFFDGLDWIALGRLEVEPPIDISVNQDSTRNVTSLEDALTMHFHEGFTNMHISHSIIEETLSNVSSPTNGRSRAGSIDNSYDGFEYFGGDMEFTVEEVQKADAFIQQKIIKVNKKKSLKAKKDEEQQKRQAVEDALRLEKQAKELEEKLKKQQIEKEENEKKAEMIRIAKLRDENTEKLKLRNQFQAKIDEFLENNNKLQKKLKALKKKLRDILDLQLKKESSPDIKLTSEQKEKLKKKGSVEQEIVEVEKELEVLVTQEPPPIPSDLINIDMDLINIQQQYDDTNQIKNDKPTTTVVFGFSFRSENDQKSNSKPNVQQPKQIETKNEKLGNNKDELISKQNEVEVEFTTVVNSKKNKKR